MRAHVNTATCIGCGLCAATCPEVFRLAGDVSSVIADPVPPASHAACRDARDGCPVSAITLDEEGGLP